MTGGWTLVYEGSDPAEEGLREALCTLGNGVFATRGAAPEAVADGTHYPGTYLAGCYDRAVSLVGGGREEHEDMVNAPNWLPLTFRPAGGRWFGQDGGELLDHRRELDLRRGVFTRTLRVRDGAGRVTRLTQRRIVSMDDPHLAALETEIVAENWSGRLEIRSALDGRVVNAGVARYRGLENRHLTPVSTWEAEPGEPGEGGPAGSGPADTAAIGLLVETRSSRLRIAEAARTTVTGGTGTGTGTAPVPVTVHREPDWIARDVAVEVAPGVPVRVEKVVSVVSSRETAIAEPLTAARAALARAPGFAELLDRHARAWELLWRRDEVRLGDPGLELAVNLYVFHLLQTLSPHVIGRDTGVPARGLHGEAYRGHVFWDELFVLPHLYLHFPDIARALLAYRWRRLPRARAAAREAGGRGAMFPWQSGSDGREETPRTHLNPRSGRWVPDRSRLQRHVGLAVAYNVWQYYEATGDRDFLAGQGGDLLIEVARCFADLAEPDPAGDRYVIRGVMGPDEYHDGYPGRARPGLDNNAYTNVLTVWVLHRAVELVSLLHGPQQRELRTRLGLTDAELDTFARVGSRMYVPFHAGVISQFDGYGELAELDWAAYRREYGDIRRLDRILEARGDSTNAYQVAKQADVLMLFFLFTAEELVGLLRGLDYPVDPELIPATIDYYLSRTAHGSTLSAVVHAHVLIRRDRPGSWAFFTEAMRGDVTDIQKGTTAEGIHLGAMAGALGIVERCYLGVTPAGGVLSLDPRLPPELPELAVRLRFHGQQAVDVRCDARRVVVGLPDYSDRPLPVAVRGRHMIVPPGGCVEVTL